MNDDVILGFDPAADGDTTVLVFSREPGGAWQLAGTDGPDAGEIARLAATIAGQPKLPLHAVDWPAQIEQWLADQLGEPFQFDDWQRTVLEQTYSEHLRDRRISH